jgi:multicomponent Na+:H+ antiporter subunit F
LALFLLLNLGAGMWRVLRGPTALIQVMMAASLTTLSAFAFVFKLVEASFGEIALAALILLASLLVAVLSRKFIATRLFALPPGDVLVSISHGWCWPEIMLTG